MKKLCITLGLLALFCSLTPNEAIARDSNPKRAFRQGKRLYSKSDYIKAIPFLKGAYNLDPENAKYAYMLGRSVFEAGDEAAAMPYLVEAYNHDQTISKEINYYLARAMHKNQMFEEAIDYYEADLQRLEPESWLYQDTKMRIDQCKNGPKSMQKVVEYKIDNLGEYVNSPYPEYAATFGDDFQYMIFTTRRPRKLKQFARRRYHVEDINEEVYEAQYIGGMWRRSKIFQKPIPSWTHDASIKLAQNGSTLVYYRDNRNHGDIYITELQDGKWTKRKSIGANVNTKEYTEPSVFFADGGQTLYWVSDKPGGKGQRDIYVSKKDANGEWGEGQNLGEGINSMYDEDAPSLSPDGKKLYFASRGHNSMGGYDLFVCEKLPDGSWSKANNMGTPINSVGDDIYLVMKDGSNGFYFSSDRPGGFGEMDMYYASPADPAAAPDATILAGTVLDNASGKPIAAEVKLIDVSTNEVVATTNTTPQNGKYRFVLPPSSREYKIDVKVAQAPLSGDVAPKTTLGKYNVVSGRVTDAVTEVPLDAEVALIDAETGKVIDSLTTNPKTGNYMFPIVSGKRYMIKVRSHEYLPYYEDFQVESNGELRSHYDDIGLQKVTEANKLVITWQFFDVDKHLIKADYIRDLDNVVDVMNQVPNMKLNIIGHTDSDGSEEHNMALSKGRAEAVAKYLVDRGIDPGRLMTSGMGESKPIYPNTTLEYKRFNRRVELFIIE